MGDSREDGVWGSSASTQYRREGRNRLQSTSAGTVEIKAEYGFGSCCRSMLDYSGVDCSDGC